MFIIQGSVEEKSFYVTPIFSPHRKENNSREYVPIIYNVQKRKKGKRKLRKYWELFLNEAKMLLKNLIT